MNIKITILANSDDWFGSEEVVNSSKVLPSRSKISFQKRIGTWISRRNLSFCCKFVGEFNATKISDIRPLHSGLPTFYRCVNSEKLPLFLSFSCGYNFFLIFTTIVPNKTLMHLKKNTKEISQISRFLAQLFKNKNVRRCCDTLYIRFCRCFW